MRLIDHLINDERGSSFLAIFFMLLFMIGCVVMFAMLWSTAMGMRNRAVESYQWFTEASDFAMRAANMAGIVSDPENNEPQVRQYFDGSFTSITQTAARGDEYDPQPGSPFKAPITLTKFNPVNEGDPVPGGTASGPGYVIRITVPVWVGTFPYVGQQTVDVPMSYYAGL